MRNTSIFTVLMATAAVVPALAAPLGSTPNDQTLFARGRGSYDTTDVPKPKPNPKPPKGKRSFFDDEELYLD
ncbi:hypothetical protein FOMPIDRAFT_1049498 [Fomitopsis schrenkii]|uniref:Uncharacterized protein n=1 Tax=Fomitopsis schrenkii TaxID=2126942 RepID=S8EC12_FOMSC|nr:hypothetical protein FOMPIDRAFT_1049498 [Fomitopsis schrenkii]